jgi:D-serine deaminase-like pyridoxal phosphate-dependent protein
VLFVMTDADLDIRRPTLLLDEKRARRNIVSMARKADLARVRFRPHFKTHQSLDVGGWFRECGVDAITVSSVTMASAFANDGWTDITIAFPVNIKEIEVIDALAGRVDLGLLVDSESTVARLAASLQNPVRVWLKVDVGYGRAGVRWDRPEEIRSLSRMVARAKQLAFTGLLTHSGHSYHAQTREEILRIHTESIGRMAAAKAALDGALFEPCLVSIGDTPSCSVAEDFCGVDEIRPGNFVFYDLMQLASSACEAEHLAVVVACPVVGKYPDRRQIVIYGGAVHLAKDTACDARGRSIFGCLAERKRNAWSPRPDDAPVVALSQEHGVVELASDLLAAVHIGDIVHVLPAHSCLTCGLHTEYRLIDGGMVRRICC